MHREYADSLFEATGQISVICDRVLSWRWPVPLRSNGWIEVYLVTLKGSWRTRKPVILPPPDGSEGIGEIEG